MLSNMAEIDVNCFAVADLELFKLEHVRMIFPLAASVVHKGRIFLFEATTTMSVLHPRSDGSFSPTFPRNPQRRL